MVAVARHPSIDLGAPGSSGMGPAAGDSAPSTALADQLRIAAAAIEVSGERGLVAEMAGLQLQAVTAFLTSADTTLQRVESFGSHPQGLQTLRSVPALDSSLIALNRSCAEIMLESQRLASELIPMLPRPQDLSNVLTAVNERAEAASLSTMRSKGTWRDQVFEREVHDSRVARILEGVASTKSGMEYSLKQHGVKGDALSYLSNALNQRVDKLVANVVADPVKGTVDSAAVRAMQDELKFYERVSVPQAGGEPLVVELSQGLRDSISARYGTLANEVERKRIPPINSYYPADGVSVMVQTDPAGKGTITFTDDTTKSTVLYTIGDKNRSAYSRVQTIRNIEAALATYGEQSSSVWNRGAAESMHSVLQTIADGAPVVSRLRLPVPETIAGYAIEDTPVSPVAGSLQVMIGTSAVTLRQEGVSPEAQHRVEIRVAGHNLTVALHGPRNPALTQELEVSVIVSMDRLEVSGQSLQAQLKLVADALKADPSCGVLRKDKGVVDALFDIPGAQVKALKGVILEKGADKTAKLAGDARVSSVRAAEGVTLRYEGEEPGAVIQDSRGSKGAAISYRLNQATLIECHDEGISAGSIRASKLVRTQFLGSVRQFISGELGTVGQAITDDQCTFEGCAWKVGLRNSLAAFGKKMILALN